MLEHLSFTLPDGTFTALIGPSGCGKTTTLRILAKLDVEYDGAIDDRLAEARLAVAFQEPRLLPWRTVGQNIALALAGVPDAPARVVEALRSVGLEEHAERFPSQLSLGQARRAALARAFAVRPKLLLLDEPFVSLDEATAQRLRALLMRLFEEHAVTVLMVTHNVREAVQLADRIVLLTDRPAKVAATVDVTPQRTARTPEAIDAFAADLAGVHPRLIAL